MNPINNTNILLGVTGSIAVYKAADLASKLTQDGAVVHTILTKAAQKFISPLTFQSLTGEKAYTEEDLWGNEAHVLHVGLAHKADILVIAPATATTISKLANGIADNLLTVTALACGTNEDSIPLLIAPAMDSGMYAHSATQENIKTLVQRGAFVIGPEEGHLASGLVAKGRMTEPSRLLGEIRYLLSRNGPLIGTKFVVTAGGTLEDLDPVRYITNRSSGKQGYALAQAALDAGAEVHLISGPTNLEIPSGLEFTSIRTASELETATLELSKNADVLCMAAAVADFRPTSLNTHKFKKGISNLSITFETTIDILKEISKVKGKSGFPKKVIGFAAESEDLIENAETKLREKGLDIIVANNISLADSGFEVDTNRVTLIFPGGHNESLPLLTKFEVAEKIILEIIKLLNISRLGSDDFNRSKSEWVQ